MAGAKPRRIVIGAGNTCQLDIAGMFEIMAAACGGEGKAGPAEIQLARQWRAAEQHVHTMKRAHPAEPGGAPSLAFRPGKIRQHTGDHVRQQRGRRRPGLVDAGEQEPAFRRVFLDKLVARQAC